MLNKKPDINSQSIQNLMMAYWKAYFSITPDRYSLLFNCTKDFAKTFNDKKAIEKLEDLWNNCAGKGFSLPAIEIIVYRDSTLGATMNKSYQFNPSTGFNAATLYQFSEKVPYVFLGDLIKALGDARIKMADIYTKICKDNDIPQKFSLGMLDAARENNLGMPTVRG